MRLRRGVVIGLLLFGLSGGSAHAAGLTAEKVFPTSQAFVAVDAAFSPNGWGIVGWVEQVTSTRWQFEVATRPPGGDWSDPTPMGVTDDHGSTSPYVAINDSGAAAASWAEYLNGSPNVLYVSTRPAGGSFTQPETFSGQYPYGLGIDGAGNVDLLYRIEGVAADNGAYVKTVAAGSPFASAVAHQFGAMGCTGYGLATSPNGDAAVSYGCTGLDFAVRHNGAWTESHPFTNTYSNCPGSGNSNVYNLGGIAIDSAGIPAAIVLNTNSQHDCSGFGFDTSQDTIILITLSGGALASGGTVAQGPSVATFGSRAGDVNSPYVGIGGGQVIASWSLADQNGMYHPMVRAYANNGAQSPGPVEPVPGAPQSNGARLATSNDGATLIAFAGYTGNNTVAPYLAVRPPAGPPGAAVAAGPATAYGGAFDISAAASGDGLLAYTIGDATALGVRARGWDATAPQLANVSIPATATAGTPVGFSAQASDIWGPISFGWDFGDGTDSGTSPSHAFTAGGVHSVSVTATDSAGNSSAQSGTVDVAPAFVPSVPAVPGAVSAPVLSRLALSAKTFRVGKKATAISAKARKKKVPTGTKIRFTLDKAASVAIKIERSLPGRKRGKRCVAPTKKLKRAKRCTRYLKAGSLTRRGVAGANKVAFSGRIGRKALKPGSYRMTLAPSVLGAVGSSKSITFKIVR